MGLGLCTGCACGQGNTRYVVRKVVRSEKEHVHLSIKWPKSDDGAGHAAGVLLTTELAIWEGTRLVSHACLPCTTRKRTYVVVLSQRKCGALQNEFVLHEAGTLLKCQMGFRGIHVTVEPLVDDCTLELTKKLLEALLIPTPREGDTLVFHLLEVAQEKPNLCDWMSVFRALMLPALMSDNTQVVEQLMIKGITPSTVINRKGDTVLQAACTLGRSKVVKTMTEGTMAPEAVSMYHSRLVGELVSAGSDLSSIGMIGSISLAEAASPLTDAARGLNPEGLATASKTFLACRTPGSDYNRIMTGILNVTNADGFTPLMVAVRNGHLETSMSLLQAEADPNIENPNSGNTALHYASEQGSLRLIKLLVIFCADISHKNKEDKTPLEVLSSSKQGKDLVKCMKILQEVSEEEEKALREEVEDSTAGIPNYRRNGAFLLSMDGGGSRCLLSCQVMIALAKRMRELEPNCRPLHKYFDYISGTSGGGIIALGMVYASAHPELCRAACLKLAEEAFEGTPTYPSCQIERCLKHVYGSEILLSDKKVPRVIVPTVLGDTLPPKLHLMTNYGGSRDGMKGPEERKVWEAARATSAAPFYFAPFEDRLVDGGCMANNPTLTAMVEILSQPPEGTDGGEAPKLGFVLSLGAGDAPSKLMDDVGIVVPRLKDSLKFLFNIHNVLSGLMNMIQMFISQSTQSSGEEVLRARTWCQSLGVPYYRFSAPIKDSYDPTIRDKVQLIDTMYEGHLYVLRSRKSIDAVARILLASHTHTHRPAEK